MKDLLIWSLENARKQTLLMVKDLSEEQMCIQSESNENHPTWTLGHLLLGDTYLLYLLKAQELPPVFSELLNKYGPNSNPNSNLERYDKKDFLVEKLTETGVLRLKAIRQMNDIKEPTPDETLAKTQPTIGHHLQMLVFHEGHHCGQISSWRKLHGFTAVKGIFAS